MKNANELIKQIIEDFNDKHVSINASDLLLLMLGYGAQEVGRDNWNERMQMESLTGLANVLNVVVNDKTACKERIAQVRRAYDLAFEYQNACVERKAENKTKPRRSARLGKDVDEALKNLVNALGKDNESVRVTLECSGGKKHEVAFDNEKAN